MKAISSLLLATLIGPFCGSLSPLINARVAPLLEISKFKGNTTGKYIVKFKEGVSNDLRQSYISSLGLRTANGVDKYENFNSFASALTPDALKSLRSSPDVEFIAEDGIVHSMTTVVQTDAPWGLERISSLTPLTNRNPSALTFRYTYDDSGGAGVDIYIVDTGIYLEHSDFGGRAIFGYSVGGTNDANGHGTHVAGTAAGTRFGVAKKANLIAVKVLNDSGSGSTAQVVAGLNWIQSRVQQTGRPAVVEMALGGAASAALDNAVTSLTSSGIHVVVVAGNSNTDASAFSPARVPSAITVGSSTINDARHSASNYGPVVDLYAPGIDVISAWVGSPTASTSLSGTSMASAHVAGLVAYLIGKEGNISPAAMSTKLIEYSLKNVLTNVPAGTANRLAYNAPH